MLRSIYQDWCDFIAFLVSLYVYLNMHCQLEADTNYWQSPTIPSPKQPIAVTLIWGWEQTAVQGISISDCHYVGRFYWLERTPTSESAFQTTNIHSEISGVQEFVDWWIPQTHKLRATEKTQKTSKNYKISLQTQVTQLGPRPSKLIFLNSRLNGSREVMLMISHALPPVLDLNEALTLYESAALRQSTMGFSLIHPALGHLLATLRSPTVLTESHRWSATSILRSLGQDILFPPTRQARRGRDEESHVKWRTGFCSLHVFQSQTTLQRVR